MYLLKSLATHNMVPLHAEIFRGRHLNVGAPLGGHFPLKKLGKSVLDLPGQLSEKPAGFIDISSFFAVPDGEGNDLIAFFHTFGEERITASLNVPEHREDF